MWVLMNYLWAYLIHVTTTTNADCVNNLAKRKIFQLEHTIWKLSDKSEVEFVTAVTAGGSVKFLPAV